MNIFFKYTKYLFSWVISFAIFIILFNKFINIEIGTTIILAGMGYALFTTFIFLGQQRHHTHFGHFPTIVGFSMFIIAGGLLFGAISWEAIDKVKWWDIPGVTEKTWLGVIAFLGFIILIFGLKSTTQQMWWWRPFGKVRM